jgi:rRNA maturation RNase YbeY
MASRSKVYFFFDNTKPAITQRSRLKSFIEAIFKTEGKQLNSVGYVFTTDEKLLEINKYFLQHDDYTDIISFDLAEKFSPVEGEIYISLDRVRDNAKKLGVTLKSEIHRVIFHGALHLSGYKDKSGPEIKQMRKLEDKYLLKYFKSFHVKK